MWVLLKNGQTLQADEVAKKFSDFGDFNIFKDSQTSCYVEFFYIDESKVKSQQVKEIIEMVNSNKEALGVEIVVPYEEAVKFKSHNRIE